MADNVIESTPSASAASHQAPNPTPSNRDVNPVYQLILSSINVINPRNSGEQASTAPGDVAGPASALTAPSVPSTVGASVRPPARSGSEQDDPETKRRKVNRESTDPVAGPSSSLTAAVQQEKLESRLGGILCCAVCLDLPRMAMYQCQMGHLMCDACFTHLLADGRLRYQPATCPNCRVEISKTAATRNLAVEKAVSELPSECQYCGQEFRSKSVTTHEQEECEERPVNCQYKRIGCQWKGPVHEAPEHEKNCLHPKKSGYDLMIVLEPEETRRQEERKLFGTLIDLLSYEKIIFNDLQMKPYRSDDYVPRLFYETSRFAAFSNQFVVEGRVNKSQRDPHQSSERQISYQLKLKTKTSTPLQIHFFALRGPFSEIKLNTQIYEHVFTDENNESEFNVLPLPDSSECNRLLSAKAINFRLLMFLVTN